jgi:hypothetical protein
MIYSFYPDDPRAKRRARKAYRPKDESDNTNWRAPEHMKLTKDMKRDFPRDDFGLPLRGSKREMLVMDPRPQIMKPENKPYFNP